MSQKEQSVTLTILLCFQIDYNRICWNDDDFLSLLQFSCHHYNFSNNRNQTEIVV